MKRKKNNVDSIEICVYLDVNAKREVTIKEIAKIFEYKDWNSVLRLFKRKPCLEFTSETVKGTRKKVYLCSHSKIKHEALYLSKLTNPKSRHKKGGLVSLNVGHIDSDIYRTLQSSNPESEKFDSDLPFEVHGIRYMTNPDKFLPNMNEVNPIESTVEWKYCDFTYHAFKGKLLVWLSPNKKFEKYGLDSKRYNEFVEFRDKILKKVFGYDVGWLLEPIQFDLHQDDYRFEWSGKYAGENLIIGNCYFMTIQRYKVYRSDRIEDEPYKPIKRFETRFKTKKTIRDLAEIIPKVLSLDVRHVESISSIVNLTERLNSQIDFFQSLVLNWVQTVEENKLKSLVSKLDNLQSEMSDKQFDNQFNSIYRVIDDLQESISSELKDSNDWKTNLSKIMVNQESILRETKDSIDNLEDGIDSVDIGVNEVRNEIIISNASLLAQLKPKTMISKVKGWFKR